jgi:hypothetical protein
MDLLPAQVAAIRHAHNLLANRGPAGQAGPEARAFLKQLRELLRTTIWKFGESPHKTRNRAVANPFWTPQADAIHRGAGGDRLVTHEHPYPKTMLVDDLIALTTPDRKAVERLFCWRAIGVVVTKEQDASLTGAGFKQTIAQAPADTDALPLRTWARYRAVGILVKGNDSVPRLHREALEHLRMLAE